MFALCNITQFTIIQFYSVTSENDEQIYNYIKLIVNWKIVWKFFYPNDSGCSGLF